MIEKVQVDESSCHLPKYCSISTAKLAAILLVFEHFFSCQLCTSLIFSDSFCALLTHWILFLQIPWFNAASSSFFTPSIHPTLSICGFLTILASRVMSWRIKLPKLPLYFLVSPDHSFSYPIYAHFPDNWTSRNGNASGNLH